MFTVRRGTGFQLTFDNGVTISAIFGKYSYSEYRDRTDSLIEDRFELVPMHIIKTHVEEALAITHDSASAELAVMLPSGTFITQQFAADYLGSEFCDGNIVLPRMITEEWLQIANWAASLTPEEIKQIEANIKAYEGHNSSEQ